MGVQVPWHVLLAYSLAAVRAAREGFQLAADFIIAGDGVARGARIVVVQRVESLRDKDQL